MTVFQPPFHITNSMLMSVSAISERDQSVQSKQLILASVFHYEFVFIHSFTDGNGRMARLWHTAILAKWKTVLNTFL